MPRFAAAELRLIFAGCCNLGGQAAAIAANIRRIRFDRVKLYASEWKNFVEITDIYEERVYVSCSDADRLVAELMPPGGNRIDEEEIEVEAEERAREAGEKGYRKPAEDEKR